MSDAAHTIAAFFRIDLPKLVARLAAGVCQRCALAPAMKQGHDCATPWRTGSASFSSAPRFDPCYETVPGRYRPRLRLIQGGKR